ncbi:permease-like cell division protein FtsX [Streptacidiphilus fuscans]|uniref:Cell division protein FtsX n=1 Tax=Streptacidiphilus fuscans TaxID=2789292 RepID=A0A931FGC2_9ACTN|nr:permease-like cell division protein FtsX [Streptacidiphilus fuscans]MBF9072483.1 ABC transporter permease [Streptacidiphilus fuscans]
MRAQFVMSEIWIGLRRNLTMTIAVIVSVALSLTLAGAAMLLNSQVSQMKGYWGDKVEVSIYFCNKNDTTNLGKTPNCASGVATQAEINQVHANLDKNSLVETVYTETPQQALVNFKAQFPDSPLAPYITADAFNNALRVKLTNPQDYDQIAGLVAGQPGVASVDDQSAVLKPLFNLMDTGQWVAVVVMVVMLGVTLLLIVNTVRVSAFSRKRETGIMRLVGASNYYVQMPFIAEAAFAAVVGAVLASGMLAIGKYVLIDMVLKKQITLISFIGWGPVVQVMPLLLVIGVGMSSLAAFLTLQKYLKV